MLFDLTANRVTVLVGHDDSDVFAAESDFDHFAHGGAVVNEINCWRAPGWRRGFRRGGRERHGFVHCDSFSGTTAESPVSGVASENSCDVVKRESAIDCAAAKRSSESEIAEKSSAEVTTDSAKSGMGAELSYKSMAVE